MTVTGHDIRMKEFKRAFLRGYAADDVDTFLIEGVIVGYMVAAGGIQTPHARGGRGGDGSGGHDSMRL